MARQFPGDGVGIQVPVGRIAANRAHWQVVLDAPGKPCLYRLHNSQPAIRGPKGGETGNSMIVEVDGGKRPVHVGPGCSADVLGKRIRVRAGTGGGQADTVEGWYVLVS